jgi:4-hydroxy-tetrahydrodipicolinate synthase
MTTQTTQQTQTTQTTQQPQGTQQSEAGRPTLRGAFTALVTPFTREGDVDEPAFRGLLGRQLAAGIDGLVPVGTTGEAPTLSSHERDRVIELTVQAVAERGATGRVPVVAGTGSNDTRASIAATRRAAALGADAALVVAPYYNKPDQRMLEAHYRAIADEGGLPIVVYNVPGRTGVNIAADTVLRLAQHERIIGLKEAAGDLEQIMTIVRDRPAGFAVLSGDDSWTLALLGIGGDGVISVASNEIPEVMTTLCAAVRDGDWVSARELHERFLPLMRVNFVSPNPVPVKAALAAMGLIEDVLRQPLLPLAEPGRARLMGILADLDLIGQPAQAVAA